MASTQSEFTSYSPVQLRELYGKDPDLFNELAADAIRLACVGSTPEQTLKLRRMQWLIDMRLRKGKTPVEKLKIMESIFYDKIYGSDGKLQQLGSCWGNLHRAIEGGFLARSRKPQLRCVKKKDH